MPNIYNDLYQELAMKCDPTVLAQLLFLNNWKEPEEFYKWTVAQRRAYKTKMFPMSDAPTKSNHWIWCGSYVGPAKTPQLNGMIITRHIYTGIIGPVDGGNLRGMFSLTRSDVNPFKYFPRMGLNRQQMASEYLMRTGESGNDVLAAGIDMKLEKHIASCVKDINEAYIEGELDTKQMMTEIMGGSYAPIVILKALELVTVPLK